MKRSLLAAVLFAAAWLALPTARGLPATPRQAVPAPAAARPSGHANISYAEARPVLDALRADLLPGELRLLPGGQRESRWPAWVSRRDAEIRARLERGDEDSVITLLLFGVTFTKQPRFSFAGQTPTTASQTGAADAVAGDPVVQGRIADMVRGIVDPGANERLQFARRVVERNGLDLGTSPGQEAARSFLADAVRRMIAEYDGFFRDGTLGSTRFRERGLSSDTSIYAAFAVDRALYDLQTNGALVAGSVRRVAIVGPGLDFADKQEGLDVYPVQTIQPFAVMDSLLRLGLGRATMIRVVTADLNPRVNQHLDAAIARAGAGSAYAIQLPRDAVLRWDAGLTSYWERFGDRIAAPVTPVTPPSGLGTVQIRAVGVRPGVVQALVPSDLNIVLQRPAPLPDDQRFDLVIATNVLVYYDVFEQSLALANIAKMLRPGGWLLTNTPLFELPAIPMTLVGETKVVLTESGADWVQWYRRE